MKNTKELLKLNIQLFADGATAGDGSAAGEGVTATDAMSQEGVTAQAATEQKDDTTKAELTPEQLEAEYEEAIKGKYKSIHQKKMSKIVSARVNDVKPLADKYNSAQPLLQKIAERYGINNAEDFAALEAALDNDDPNLEDEALELDMPVEQLKKMKAIERENKQWRAQEEKRQKEAEQLKRQEAVNKQLEMWNGEEAKVKAVYPNFNLDNEVKNRDFAQLLSSGIPMQKAYEVMHFQELMTSGMQAAHKDAEQKIAKAVASNTKRVAENGVGGNSAVVHTDVSKMTREQINEINNRVLRGERIIL